ncbi:hypothetical protein C8P68_106365 [Mucilaginibacter yixingensis]|uniref:Uncharacterized protein n=1 Tax=Mucilaginibacter yixingensis TaxID=1295612 RepID=A0A2T5J7M3_9SPHI|nr:hypothetical protein C8P68_106365 [Mucilaginibacter yixingensis]
MSRLCQTPQFRMFINYNETLHGMVALIGAENRINNINRN